MRTGKAVRIAGKLARSALGRRTAQFLPAAALLPY
jgi:hypothetical protein